MDAGKLNAYSHAATLATLFLSLPITRDPSKDRNSFAVGVDWSQLRVFEYRSVRSM